MNNDRFRVMIADGTPSVRQFIRYAIEDHFPRADIEIASNGKNIRARLQSGGFDLIIYDCEMPLFNGYELLNWIKNEESLKSTPVIIVSADRAEASLKRLINLGADACLVKPLLAETLVSKVRALSSQIKSHHRERRRHERMGVEGVIYINAGEKNIRGELINITAAGFLGKFRKDGFKPTIMDNVDVAIESPGKSRVTGIRCMIVRLEAVLSGNGSGGIHCALKVDDDISDEKRQELAEFLLSLTQDGSEALP
jgi:CheY-like chemotaxis protein